MLTSLSMQAIWWLSQHQGWKFSMRYQFISIGLFLLISFGTYHITFLLTDVYKVSFLVTITISGAMYLLLAGIVFYLMP